MGYNRKMIACKCYMDGAYGMAMNMRSSSAHVETFKICHNYFKSCELTHFYTNNAIEILTPSVACIALLPPYHPLPPPTRRVLGEGWCVLLENRWASRKHDGKGLKCYHSLIFAYRVEVLLFITYFL